MVFVVEIFKVGDSGVLFDDDVAIGGLGEFFLFGDVFGGEGEGLFEFVVGADGVVDDDLVFQAEFVEFRDGAVGGVVVAGVGAVEGAGAVGGGVPFVVVAGFELAVGAVGGGAGEEGTADEDSAGAFRGGEVVARVIFNIVGFADFNGESGGVGAGFTGGEGVGPGVGEGGVDAVGTGDVGGGGGVVAVVGVVNEAPVFTNPG